MQKQPIQLMNGKCCLAVLMLILLFGCISQPSVVTYAKEKGISDEIIDSLKRLENDGVDEHEKLFIDLIAGLPESTQKIIINSVLKDETVTELEIAFLIESLDMDDLIPAVFESGLAQSIDNESLEHLKDIKEIAKADPEMAEKTLALYYPQPVSMQPPTDSMALHKNAWEKVVEKTKEDYSYKYSIFMARTLAVVHPEVYLQADGLFVTIITTNKGFKKWTGTASKEEIIELLRALEQAYGEIYTRKYFYYGGAWSVDEFIELLSEDVCMDWHRELYGLGLYRHEV